MGIIKNFRFRISDFACLLDWLVVRKGIRFCIGFFKVFFVAFLLFILPAFKSYAQPVKIGVALPLFQDSDDEAKKLLGNEILNGFQFALSDYKQSAGSPDVLLDIRDTKRDINTTVDICKAFADNDSIKCILGPVFSAELDAVADIGSSQKIPIVSPTATGDDLAETHDYIFQLNPSYEVRGKLMADYLLKILGLKRFVVIAEESYGVNFSKHFENEVTGKGGKILLSKTYSKVAKNITDIIKEILKIIKDNDLFINMDNLNLAQREKLITAGVRESLIDSLVNLKKNVSIYYLLGNNALKVIDTVNIKPFTLKDDNSNYIQGYIEAIYLPISNPSEISLLVPELYSNGLSFMLAGTGDWNNEKALDDNKMYIKNLIFESEYFPDEQSTQYMELKSKLSKTKYKLDKNFLFGYDAMKVLLSVISGGNRTRTQINDGLEKVKSYDAIKSKISLDYNGVNSELNILSYSDKLNRVGIYKLEK